MKSGSGLFKIASCIILLIQAIIVSGQVAAVQFAVHIPEATKVDKSVYLAGSFNCWHAADSLYRMKEKGNGWYTLTIPVFDAMHYEYKYTMGSWEKVELSRNDSDISNRRFISSNKKKITDTVINWKQQNAKSDSSEQMKRIVAMKDSLMAKIKPELEGMQSLLKSYVQNMLRENPDKSQHQQLDDQAIQKIGNIYRQITQLFWNICASLSPEQKQQVLKAIDKPANGDFLNAFLNGVNGAVK
jgi:hypothetical protein